MKTDLFQSCGNCWVLKICWHTECSTFTASSFRIWNSSTGIPSPPLALFVVMLSKAHLSSHSRISGSTWVITPSEVLLLVKWTSLWIIWLTWHELLLACTTSPQPGNPASSPAFMNITPTYPGTQTQMDTNILDTHSHTNTDMHSICIWYRPMGRLWRWRKA